MILVKKHIVFPITIIRVKQQWFEGHRQLCLHDLRDRHTLISWSMILYTSVLYRRKIGLCMLVIVGVIKHERNEVSLERRCLLVVKRKLGLTYQWSAGARGLSVSSGFAIGVETL